MIREPGENRNSGLRANPFNTIYFYLLLFISILIPLSPAIAQPDSLSAYLELAVKNNPVVRQRYSEYQAALQKIPQAGTLPDPELSSGIFLKPMELVGGNQVTDLRLMQMFPWFGVLKAAKDEMSLMAKARLEELRDAKLEVCYEVQRTALELGRIREEISIAEKNLALLQSVERISIAKFSAGPAGDAGPNPGQTSMPASPADKTLSSGVMGVMSGNAGSNTGGSGANPRSPMPVQPGGSMGSGPGDPGLTGVYRLQLETGELRDNLASLHTRQTTVAARFNALLDRNPGQEIYLRGTTEADSPEMPYPAARDSLLKNNPMLGMLDYEKQSRESRKIMVTRMGYPMVGLGLNYTVISKNGMSTSSMNGKDMLMPMVTVTLPVYRKKYKAMQTEAAWQQKAMVQARQSAVNSLQTELIEEMQRREDAHRRLNLYREQSLLARKSLDISIRSFSAGTSALTEVLNLLRQSYDYDLKQVGALADYNMAVARIKRLTANEK